MSAAQLSRHLDWMASGRVKVVSLLDLIDGHGDDESIALTFDDGLTNFGEIAAPLLAERDLPATVFIAPAHIGTSNSWDDANREAIPRFTLLSWDEIRALSGQGFEFGGHGYTHIPLAGIGSDSINKEIVSCSEVITSELGIRPRSFAYPYGQYDQLAIAAVASSFDLACTTQLRCLKSGDSPYVLPRLDMYYFKDLPIGRMWGTLAFTPYVKLRAAGRTIRSSLGIKF